MGDGIILRRLLCEPFLLDGGHSVELVIPHGAELGELLSHDLLLQLLYPPSVGQYNTLEDNEHDEGGD